MVNFARTNSCLKWLVEVIKPKIPNLVSLLIIPLPFKVEDYGADLIKK